MPVYSYQILTLCLAFSCQAYKDYLCYASHNPLKGRGAIIRIQYIFIENLTGSQALIWVDSYKQVWCGAYLLLWNIKYRSKPRDGLDDLGNKNVHRDNKMR